MAQNVRRIPLTESRWMTEEDAHPGYYQFGKLYRLYEHGVEIPFSEGTNNCPYPYNFPQTAWPTR